MHLFFFFSLSWMVHIIQLLQSFSQQHWNRHLSAICEAAENWLILCLCFPVWCYALVSNREFSHRKWISLMSFASLYLKICAPPPTKLSLTDPCLPSVGATSHCVIDVLFYPGSRLSQCTLLSSAHGHTLFFVVLYMRNVFGRECWWYQRQVLKCLWSNRSNNLYCQHTVLKGLDIKVIQLQDTKGLFFFFCHAYVHVVYITKNYLLLYRLCMFQSLFDFLLLSFIASFIQLYSNL